jgi:hypothetical protein
VKPAAAQGNTKFMIGETRAQQPQGIQNAVPDCWSSYSAVINTGNENV